MTQKWGEIDISDMEPSGLWEQDQLLNHRGETIGTVKEQADGEVLAAALRVSSIGEKSWRKMTFPAGSSKNQAKVWVEAFLASQ